MDYEGLSRKDLIKMLEEANDNVEHYEKQCEAKDEEYETMVEEKNEEISELERQNAELEEKLQLEEEWKEDFASEVEASVAEERRELQRMANDMGNQMADMLRMSQQVGSQVRRLAQERDNDIEPQIVVMAEPSL